MMTERYRLADVKKGTGNRAKHSACCLVAIGLLLAWPATGTHAGPIHPLAIQLDALQVPGLHWEEPQSVDMSDVPMHVRAFSSRLDAVQVARHLASKARYFQRLTTLGHTLMLSGLHEDAHWLAQIDVSATGSSGYVSVLASAATPSIRAGQDLTPHGWLPGNSARLYRHRSTSKGRTLAQYVYTVNAPADVSMAYVRQQLRRQGWAHEPSLAGVGGGSVWSRKGAELAVFASAQPQGSALYIQHFE